MAQRTTFAKLQRERAKKMKAEEKRARRQGTPVPGAAYEQAPPTSGPRVPVVDGDGPLAPDQLLKLVEQLTAAYEAGLIDDEEFESKKKTLMSRV